MSEQLRGVCSCRLDDLSEKEGDETVADEEPLFGVYHCVGDYWEAAVQLLWMGCVYPKLEIAIEEVFV